MPYVRAISAIGVGVSAYSRVTSRSWSSVNLRGGGKTPLGRPPVPRSSPPVASPPDLRSLGGVSISSSFSASPSASRSVKVFSRAVPATACAGWLTCPSTRSAAAPRTPNVAATEASAAGAQKSQARWRAASFSRSTRSLRWRGLSPLTRGSDTSAAWPQANSRRAGMPNAIVMCLLELPPYAAPTTSPLTWRRTPRPRGSLLPGWRRASDDTRGW
jgi:hypothetical protein